MESPRRVLLVAASAFLLGACESVTLPTEIPLEPSEARRPKPPPQPSVEEFDEWNATVWVAGDHPLGKGYLDPDNVSHGAGELLLTLPGGNHDGAEIRSEERFSYGTYEARMRTEYAPGSISTFFLYELVRKGNDEIDIEIFNDGSRKIWFTTWVADVQTNHSEHILPFDPADGYHDYRIEWSRNRVRFFVDGSLMETFTKKVPRARMHLFSNHWWPNWLTEGPPSSPRSLRIDRITY